jgi:hypothetical protein
VKRGAQKRTPVQTRPDQNRTLLEDPYCVIAGYINKFYMEVLSLVIDTRICIIFLSKTETQKSNEILQHPSSKNIRQEVVYCDLDFGV